MPKEIKDYKQLSTDISNWIKEYAENAGLPNLIVGCSGGIDSSVVSTLCAMTGLPTYCLSIDVNSSQKHLQIAANHIQWLEDHYEKVISRHYDLSDVFNSFVVKTQQENKHAEANSKSRLRMMTLYHLATSKKGLVIGCGQKPEDFGVGFFTKYGDGGVDISPIADLMKSEVYELGKELGIIQEVIKAAPTDGLWGDNRTDEEQLGISYDEVEFSMNYLQDNYPNLSNEQLKLLDVGAIGNLLSEEKRALKIYIKFHTQNKHKMIPIPVYDTTKHRI